VHDVTSKLEKSFYWMDEAKKYADYGDTYYSGVCFEKAYLLAEELLQLHDSHKTFLRLFHRFWRCSQHTDLSGLSGSPRKPAGHEP